VRATGASRLQEQIVSTPTPLFHGFFGQREAVRFLRRIARGSLKYGKPFPHTLFLGGSGLGKTHLAKALAKELDTGFCPFVCSGSTTPLEIGMAAKNWQSHEIVFLDEVHGLRPQMQEMFYRVMIERKAPNVIDESEEKRPKVDGEFNIPPVTIIGATDRPGDLRNAFLKRFDHQVSLQPYRISEMIEIVRHAASKERLVLKPQAARFLAERCRGIPRFAGQYLGKFHMFYSDKDKNVEFTLPHMREFCRQSGLDEYGRTADDQRYMHHLEDGGSKSLSTLSLILQHDRDYLRRHIEPWLLQQGWVEITSDGRRLTEVGVKIANESGLEVTT
jgi:holliday junction DNA helicase RuvB